MSREDEQFKRDTERALAFSEKESRSKEQQDMDKALALSLKERTTAAALARHQQKTAYEIGVRLVGSEMCIRDRSNTPPETKFVQI